VISAYSRSTAFPFSRHQNDLKIWEKLFDPCPQEIQISCSPEIKQIKTAHKQFLSNDFWAPAAG